ncbi:MAG: peptidoglycan bridge formation protein FemAB [Planctomycetes bacterium]|nr:peptidoglycan bridge formation protein FemAB [Planctomycetota bacterium]
MSVVVKPLTPELEAGWTSFVTSHASGTLFHALEWRDLLLQTFRHEARYYVALRDDSVVGVLPLVAIRSIFFGRSVISVPFGVYGGIVADDSEAAHALAGEARELLMDVGAAYVELRHVTAPPGLEDLPKKDLYCTFAKDLPDDPTDVLGTIPRKARAEVRKARKRDDVTTEVAELDLREFHDLFAQNKRKLGSPVFPKSLFMNLNRILGDRCTVLTVRLDGRAVAAVMNFVWRDTLMAYYSGAGDEANRISANNLMYAASMEWAVEQGLKQFDFGRSRMGTGAFAFKKNMGFEPVPLDYQFLLADGAPLPEINASNPRYDMAKKLFRILPTFAAEKLGSFVAKRMPV